MMVRQSGATTRRKGVAPSVVAVVAALAIGSVVAASGAAASTTASNSNAQVTSLAVGETTPLIGESTLAGWAVTETDQTSRPAYDPSASELLALLDTTSVLQDTRQLTSEALSVQAEMDAIESARQEAIRRAAAIAAAAEIYSESVGMGQLSPEEVAQLAADMGLQPGDFIVPAANTTVTSPYGFRLEPLYGYLSWHSALDLGADCWQEIYASADGVVTYAEYYGQLGLWVKMNHGDISTGYGHMSEIAVTVGQEVKQGDLIGYVGNTGYSFGCHIHWQAFAGDSDKTFDPTVLIAAGQIP
jgi:murein DD-endopeptidase MepM/ murein hydrolase activator NlpD